MYFVQYKRRAWEWITMNMAANRTRKGSLLSHHIRTMGHCRKRAVGSRSRTSPLPSRIDTSRTTEGIRPRLWTTPLVALTGTLVLSPPRMRRVPGFNTHPIQAGRPSKPSAFHGSDGVAPLSAPPRESTLGCGLHHLVAGRGALCNREPEHSAGLSSTYR